MTDKIKSKLDSEMIMKWKQYVYKEVILPDIKREHMDYRYARNSTQKQTRKASMQAIIRKHAKTFGGSLTDRECMKLAEVSKLLENEL